jgi:membrane-associated protease RseP (regulator of RpoE activity)
VGLAGPIAGLLVAIPVLLMGLQRSQLGPSYTLSVGGTLFLGKSLLYKAIARAALGSIPPGMDVASDPIAFAGWFGLFITAMNLMPIGQLDGGHVAYAVWGRGHSLLARTTFVGLIAMGIGPWLLSLVPGIGPVPGWSGWLVWAVLLSLFGLRHPPALDDVTSLGWPRRLLGVLSLLLMLSLITPVPFRIH